MSKKVLTIFEPFAKDIDNEIKSLLGSQQDYAMYSMMGYFMGYKNEKFEEKQNYGGQRFRSSLSQLIASYYGCEKDNLYAAAALEIFHNFTLIHDDIEDNDTLRRGRATVWSIWGLAHGVNTGDAQLILTYKELEKGLRLLGEPYLQVQYFLNDIFQKVAEGQFMEFELGEYDIDNPKVTVDAYYKVVEHKTSVLVGAATKVPGIVACLEEKEQEALWQFGLNVGLSYQILDDYRSLWCEKGEIGKSPLRDLYQKTKTIPILYAYSKLDDTDKSSFLDIYNKRTLKEIDVIKLKALIDSTDAKSYTLNLVRKHNALANQAVETLTIDAKSKDQLKQIAIELLPEATKKC
jgi:geranylgeranyl pyrophosphate synthase